MDYKKNNEQGSDLLTKTSKILKRTNISGKSAFKSMQSDAGKKEYSLKHTGLPQSLKRI
jgi:hypothetical protein